MTVKLQKDDFDIGQELAALQASVASQPVGAMASFTGLVRADVKDKKPLIAMELECFEPMCLKTLQELESEAITRWQLSGCLIIHRFGRLLPAENIMMVATLAAHRQQAFDAASFLMDYLKSRAPFWKKEFFDGAAHWVAPRTTDEDALQKW